MGSRTYSEFRNLVEQIYQDTGNAVAGTVEWDYWIEEGLKKFSTYRPHLVDVIFKLESRFGDDVTGTTDKLTDSVKAQFLAGDATDEKVVHNLSQNTYAVVLAQDSTSIFSISKDIFSANEAYRIYNKRCTNNRQIFIGDFMPYMWIDSVEYPVGEKRNWKELDDVIEIMVDQIPDSDSTLDRLPDVDVLVRFAVAHKISQLVGLTGQVATTTTAGATSLASATMGAGTIEIGEEFHLENQRFVYTVTTATTIASNTATISFFPGLDSDASNTAEVLTFRKNTLRDQDEEIFGRLVAARAAMSDSRSFINTINIGGPGTWADYMGWKRELYNEVINELGGSKPRSKRLYTRG
ncbi:hypothetical protein LCGC14_0931410 [marine sediment metagenome]|uniref:Uncharacterized protein n=1 Tax=marine sediment metagenome TaxID=412755 RepID=A0A0F9P8S7_9ZZZZ